MKAVRLHAYGGPENFVYEDAPDPQPGPGEVLVEVKAASINPADFKIRGGAYRAVFAYAMPVILGTDIAGVVAAIGPDTRTDLKVGERVLALLDMRKAGAYAEQATGDASLFARIPAGMSFEAAAALPMVGLTGEQAVEHDLRPARGQTILIAGALGSISRVVLHFARKSGARLIAGVRADKLAAAEKLGADGVVALDDAAALDRLQPFDAILDVTGGASAASLVSRLRDGGRFVAVNPPAPQAPADRRVEIMTTQVKPDTAMLGRLAESVAAGELSVPIARVLKLSELAEGHRLAEASGSAGKLVLVP